MDQKQIDYLRTKFRPQFQSFTKSPCPQEKVLVMKTHLKKSLLIETV